MNYSTEIILGHFCRRNRHHCLPRSRPQHIPQHTATCGRSASWKDPGHTYHFPLPCRHCIFCHRDIDPLVVLSHPRSFLHIRAQCSQGTSARNKWTIRNRSAPILHGNSSAVHRRADLARLADFMAERLGGFRDRPWIENMCAGMAGRKRHCYVYSPA